MLGMHKNFILVKHYTTDCRNIQIVSYREIIYVGLQQVYLVMYNTNDCGNIKIVSCPENSKLNWQQVYLARITETSNYCII